MMAPSGPRSWQFADKGRPQAYTRILAYVCVNQKYRHNILVTRRRSVSLCCTRPKKLCVVHFLSLMISRIPSVIISPKIHLKKRCILSQDVFSSLSFFLCSLLSLHLAGPLHLSILRESRVFNFFFLVSVKKCHLHHHSHHPVCCWRNNPRGLPSDSHINNMYHSIPLIIQCISLATTAITVSITTTSNSIPFIYLQILTAVARWHCTGSRLLHHRRHHLLLRRRPSRSSHARKRPRSIKRPSGSANKTNSSKYGYS